MATDNIFDPAVHFPQPEQIKEKDYKDARQRIADERRISVDEVGIFEPYPDNVRPPGSEKATSNTSRLEVNL